MKRDKNLFKKEPNMNIQAIISNKDSIMRKITTIIKLPIIISFRGTSKLP
jgi:hypothetical protein